MAVIYRYVDDFDGVIKYVGIIYEVDRYLENRHKEHMRNDDWCKTSNWRVECLIKNIESRTDAEFLEAHYINKFHTDNWYNDRKSSWGISSLYDDSKDEWATIIVDTTFEDNVKRGIKYDAIKNDIYQKCKITDVDIVMAIEKIIPTRTEMEHFTNDELKCLQHDMLDRFSIIREKLDCSENMFERSINEVMKRNEF